MTRGLAGSPLGRLIRAPRLAPAAAEEERCELCGQLIGPGHRHLMDVPAQALLCACRACSLLFDRCEAGGRHYRLVPDRSWRVEDFALSDTAWTGLRVPVGLAFFRHVTPAERMVTFYPGPMGATESPLDPEDWARMEADNPVLRAMEADVEALLVNRVRGASEHWLVPVDACYRLVAVMRRHWRGLGGGSEVWTAIDDFFRELRERSKTASREGRPGGSAA